MLVWLSEVTVDSTDKLFNTDPERLEVSQIFHACREALAKPMYAHKLAELANAEFDARTSKESTGPRRFMMS